jgi:prepilin signal peptidase PulO-like enzyme (type II secretory pathway)
MDWVFNFLIFLLGLIVGSFLNCLIYRLKKGKGFFWGRSFCPHCKHKLAFWDLIPFFSFFLLKGKCRYCGKLISWQYPLVELSTAIIFLLIIVLGPTSNMQLINFESILASFFMFLASCFLIIIFVYDLKFYTIPDKIIYPAIATTFLYQLFRVWNFGHWDFFRIWNLGFGILPSLFFLAIILLSHGQWMGFGDFKLAVFMGLFLGFPNILVALFLAFFIGALVGLSQILAGEKTLKSRVPFGPFLVTGIFLALFWGERIINWYLNLII